MIPQIIFIMDMSKRYEKTVIYSEKTIKSKFFIDVWYKTFEEVFYMNKKNDNYGVSLSSLWFHLLLMKLFAYFDRKNSADAIQANINSVFMRVISKINMICKNYIATHRDLIIEAYLNETNSESNIYENKSASILQQKKKAKEAARKAQENASKIAKRKNDIAKLLICENEITEYVDSITKKANSYVYKYLRTIQKKNPQLTNNVNNPFDNFNFNIIDYNLRIKEDMLDVQS